MLYFCDIYVTFKKQNKLLKGHSLVLLLLGNLKRLQPHEIEQRKKREDMMK